jgi:tRNA A37 threonylcarbamoyladenosine synthetase subunit TsaC/SUA5/YrdC
MSKYLIDIFLKVGIVVVASTTPPPASPPPTTVSSSARQLEEKVDALLEAAATSGEQITAIHQDVDQLVALFQSVLRKIRAAESIVPH